MIYTLAVNPEQDIYEQVRGLVKRMRREGAKYPLKVQWHPLLERRAQEQEDARIAARRRDGLLVLEISGDIGESRLLFERVESNPHATIVVRTD